MQNFRLHTILNIADSKTIAVPASWGSKGNRTYQIECSPGLNIS